MRMRSMLMFFSCLRRWIPHFIEHEGCPSDFRGESPGKVASLAPFPFFTSQYSRYANMVSLGLLMCTLADLLATGFWAQLGLKERSFAAPFFYLQNGDFQGPRAATSYQYLFHIFFHQQMRGCSGSHLPLSFIACCYEPTLWALSVICIWLQAIQSSTTRPESTTGGATFWEAGRGRHQVFAQNCAHVFKQTVQSFIPTRHDGAFKNIPWMWKKNT